MFKKASLWAASLVGVASLLVNIGVANAALTFGPNSVTTDGAYTVDGVAGSTFLFGPSLTTGTITMGGTAQTGTITIGGGTGAQTINLDTGGTGVKTIHIGDAAVANVITIGSNTGAASLVLRAGTGAITLGSKLLTALSSGSLTSSESGAGVPTIATGSTDTAGMVTTSTTSHTTATLTFSSAYPNAPFCVIAPANAAAATLFSGTGAFVTTTTTTMVITTAADTTAAAWTYHCFGR